MGNPVIRRENIQKLIDNIVSYEHIIKSTSLQEPDKLFKMREIERKMKELNDDIQNLLDCHTRNDFRLTEEEKAFYLQRFLLLSYFVSND